MEHTDDTSGALGPAGPGQAFPRDTLACSGPSWMTLARQALLAINTWTSVNLLEPEFPSGFCLMEGNLGSPARGGRNTATDVVIDGAGLEGFFPHGLTTLYDTYSVVVITAVIPKSLTG